MRTLHPEQTYHLQTPRILFVDDDHEDQILLQMAFDSTDNLCSLDIVSSGKDALDYLQQRPEHKLPNLIVLDYHLPGHNGWHLMQQLNASERYRKIKKVILSTSCSAALSQFTKNEHLEYYIKPSSFNELKQLAMELLHLSATSIEELTH